MVTEPRLTAEYPVIADAPLPVLHYLTEVLSEHYQRPYARLWMNWYRDNDDGTGWHVDRPQNQLAETVIPVLSLGATRRFLIRPEGGGPSTTIVTHGGDLVVMGGRCQKDYQHSVPKQKQPAGAPLSLNFATDVPAAALAAFRAGADAVSLINTVRGMALDPRTGQPWLGGTTGGVSGPAIRPTALALLHAVAQAIPIPIVAMGGVQRGADAYDLMRAGATLVAVGTESFRDPAAGLRIADELSQLLANSAV